MHKTYAKQGLVCISLNPIDGSDAKLKAAAKQFLEEQGAIFSNFLLMDNDPPKALAEKFPTDVTPTLIIFNRRGERVKVLEEDEDLKPENVEKIIKDLLNEKA